jgi:hypothetical protein
MVAALSLAVEDSISQSDAFVAFLLANGHFLLEVLLFGAIVFLLLQRSYKPDKKPLTERVRAGQPRTRQLLRCPWRPHARSARAVGGAAVALLDDVQPGLTAHVVGLAQEIDTLCAEWQPEPLVPALTPAQRAAKPPVLVG